MLALELQQLLEIRFRPRDLSFGRRRRARRQCGVVARMRAELDVRAHDRELLGRESLALLGGVFALDIEVELVA